MPEAKDYVIGSLTLALLLSFGFSVEPDANFLSRDLGVAKYCDHLSSTNKTCYPFSATKIGGKFSSSGWEPIDLAPPIIPPENMYPGIMVWECSFETCARIH